MTLNINYKKYIHTLTLLISNLVIINLKSFRRFCLFFTYKKKKNKKKKKDLLY